MNYSKAKGIATIYTAARKVDHAIIEVNGIFDVVIAKNYDGEIKELVKYEEAKYVVEPIKSRGKKSGNTDKTEDQPETTENI